MQTDLSELLQRIDQAIEDQNYSRALQLAVDNWHNLQDPAMLRERVALTLATSGNKRRASEVYDLVARHYANAGFPTRALAAIKQMQALNPSSTQLLDHFTTLYSVRSPFLERDLRQPRLPDPVDDLQLDVDTDGVDFDELMEQAFTLATEPDNTAERPGSLPALPLLSLLPPKALRRLLDEIEYEIHDESQPIFSPDLDGEDLFWTVGANLVVTDGDADPLRIPAGTLLGLNNFGNPEASPSYTVYSQPGSECLRLTAEAIDGLTDEFPDFPNRLSTLYRHALTEGLLESHPLFAELHDQARDQVPELLTGLQLRGDTVLIRQNKISPGLYIVLDGNVQIVRQRNSDDVTIETLKPGDILGEIGLIDPRPVPVTAITDGPAHVLFMHRDQFVEFADRHPSLARAASERAENQTSRIMNAL